MSTSPTTPGTQTYPTADDLREVYQQLCTAYHAIEDFRAKLLGLLPFVTASSFAATFLGDPTAKANLLKLVLPFGLLGALVTLGLFMHELNNLRRLEWLRREGYELEKRLNLEGYGIFAPLSHQANKHAEGLLKHYEEVYDLVAPKEPSDDHGTTARPDLADRVHGHC